MKPIHVLVCAVAAVAVLALIAPTPVGAVASGANGRIVFVSDRDGDKEIYAIRPDGKGLRQLTDNTAQDYDPSVSMDGTKVAFITDRDGTTELYTMNIDGSGQLRVTTNTMTESHPSWAPTGKLIAFAALVGTDSDIWRVNTDGRFPTDLTPDVVSFDANPAWSPGGISIAFDSTNRDGNTGTDIYTMKNDGTLITRLTLDGKSSNPNWAADNKNITFESAKDTSSGGPSLFASVNSPTGVAVTLDRVLVTQFNTDKVRSLDSAGTMTTFADLPPTGNRAAERYIAVSPGLGGFPADYVYVTVGKDVYQITPDGATVTLFVHIDSLPESQTGITFDSIGNYGFKMILTNRTGPIWTVDSAGVATQIGDLGKHVQESPQVAPLSFGPFGGQLLVGSKFVDQVYAVSPGGVISVVGDWDSPKGAIPVPLTACDFGTSGGAYFIAFKDQNQIVKFAATDFTGLGDDLLVPSELTTDIGRFHWNGSIVETSTFWPPIGTPDMEGSAFAPCPAPRSGAPLSGAAVRAANVAGPHEIYKMASSGANQTRLTTNTTDDASPAWSPDNLSIVFQTDRDDPNQPTCEGSGTCEYEIYSMSATDGSNQTNVTNNVSVTDTTPDWETVQYVVTIGDNFFTPNQAKPKLGGAVLWENTGLVGHTVTDDTGMGLFDSGTKNPGGFYVLLLPGSGVYAYTCVIHPTEMNGTIKVPITAAPKSGDLSTVFTITWGGTNAPSGYVFDVQILRPGGSWVDWKTSQLGKSSTFTADGGTGSYSFKGHLRKLADGTTSDWSAPVTITVNP